MKNEKSKMKALCNEICRLDVHVQMTEKGTKQYYDYVSQREVMTGVIAVLFECDYDTETALKVARDYIDKNLMF